MKNLYDKDYAEILDVTIGAFTSGLKNRTSRDRLLALKAMKRAADIMFKNASDYFTKKHNKIVNKIHELEELL